MKNEACCQNLAEEVADLPKSFGPAVNTSVSPGTVTWAPSGIPEGTFFALLHPDISNGHLQILSLINFYLFCSFGFPLIAQPSNPGGMIRIGYPFSEKPQVQSTIYSENPPPRFLPFTKYPQHLKL